MLIGNMEDIHQVLCRNESTKLPAPPSSMSPRQLTPVSVADLAGRHPVISLLYARSDEPGAYDSASLEKFLTYETNYASNKVIPYNLTDFYTDYVNYSVIDCLTTRRSQYRECHFKFDFRGMLDQLAKVAFLNVVRENKITEAVISKVLPTLELSDTSEDNKRSDEKKGKENGEKDQPDIFFRTFGILDRVEESNKKVFYEFRENCVRDYLVALFLANECKRKIAAGKKGYHVVSTTMREAIKRLPKTGDIWRIAFGIMSDERRTKECQKDILRELIEESKLISALTPFEITNLCVEAIYESQNAGELTELLDDFSLNQTIRYSNEYLSPSRLPYAVSAVGYLVRASGNVYGVHMSKFGLGQKNIAMLADPVNDVSDNNLQVLNLSCNPLGASGMKGLLRFLVKATLLTHLDLTSCDLGNVGIALLSEFFMCMPLRYLRLSDNKLGDAGVKRLVRNLRYVPTLEWLDLSENNITDKGAEKLGHALVSLPNLRSLDVRRNNIGDEGAESISMHLSKLNQVTQLMLGENKIGKKGATKLSAHVWKTKSLRYVNLSLNNIPAEGIMGLRKAAQDHGDLKISVSNQTQSSGDINLSTMSEDEYDLPEPENGAVPRRTNSNLSTQSNINLLDGRDADFNRGRPLRRSWSRRDSFRRSWHEVSGSFRRPQIE